MDKGKLTGNKKVEVFYSEIQKLAKEKNITPEAAKKELMKKKNKK